MCHFYLLESNIPAKKGRAQFSRYLSSCAQIRNQINIQYLSEAQAKKTVHDNCVLCGHRVAAAGRPREKVGKWIAVNCNYCFSASEEEPKKDEEISLRDLPLRLIISHFTHQQLIVYLLSRCERKGDEIEWCEDSSWFLIWSRWRNAWTTPRTVK